METHPASSPLVSTLGHRVQRTAATRGAAASRSRKDKEGRGPAPPHEDTLSKVPTASLLPALQRLPSCTFPSRTRQDCFFLVCLVILSLPSFFFFFFKFKVKSVHCKAGDTVGEGDLLVELE